MAELSGRAALSGAARIGIVLELLLSIGALAGGAGLVAMATEGGPMGLPMTFLDGTPFPDYTIPGIVLFAGNGLLPLVAIALALRRHPLAAFVTIGVGVWSIAWIVAEILYIKEIIPLFHIGYTVLGAAIAACGYLAFRSERLAESTG